MMMAAIQAVGSQQPLSLCCSKCLILLPLFVVMFLLLLPLLMCALRLRELPGETAHQAWAACGVLYAQAALTNGHCLASADPRECF